ncbi:MAG: glycosyltransferase family 39 protein, partial [Deltaproteobacteria bacterium]|nr:glycosyltransferase family 39 protein [Deltaproteobacteria bacterium]
PPTRRLGVELAFVVLVACAVLVPGIWRYSLVDPWETHYGEVARNMLVDHDYVHTQWPGTNLEDQPNEGFRSKPVLSFWMMAAGLQAVGVGEQGGYSGEMVDSVRVMIGIRLPFILSAIAGLVLMWWMLARLVSRRVAWLALLVVGSTPFFCLIARQAIPDMPLVACTMGAIALFTMSVEDGERAIVPRWYLTRRWRIPLDARHVLFGLAGGFVVIQIAYDTLYFARSREFAMMGLGPNPALWLPLLAIIGLGVLARDGFTILRLPLILLTGAPLALAFRDPAPTPPAGVTAWRGFFDTTVAHWQRYSLDRYLVRVFVLVRALRYRTTWAETGDIADHILQMKPITTMRQVYILGCYALLGVLILAKGPPGLALVGGVGLFHVLLLGRWRALYEGAFELKRGIALAIIIFLPWHLAMWMKAGSAFVSEYLYVHILNRATSGVDNSPGTFEYYTDQLGHGMWLWAALLPAALVGNFIRARIATREGRVRFMVAVWAVVAVFFYSFIQTKFHHYFLPAIPPLGILIAFYLDDLLAGRDRLHPLMAALGCGIVLFICRDLMFEPDRWIEMFVFRYDRPWPHADPWKVDPSDAFLVLGLIGAFAIIVTATRFVRTGVFLLGATGLAICLWSLHVYMPIAGTHWGMRDAIRTYYEQRTVHGQHLVYFDGHQLREDWAPVTDTWSFDTFVPDTLQLGQPMTLKIQTRKPDDERVTDKTVALVGAVTAIGEHAVTVTLAPGERAKLTPMLAGPAGPRGRRAALRVVDADKLIAWQLYWRGEQFWSAGEIWSFLPEMRTTFPPTNNTEWNKYLADRTRMPIGRRYFLVTDAGRITSVKGMLPTPRAQKTFQLLDTTSNKFSLGAFDL